MSGDELHVKVCGGEWVKCTRVMSSHLWVKCVRSIQCKIEWRKVKMISEQWR